MMICKLNAIQNSRRTGFKTHEFRSLRSCMVGADYVVNPSNIYKMLDTQKRPIDEIM